MSDEIVVFSVFTLICSAILVVQMLEYTRRINRLRKAVTVLSNAAETAQHRAFGDHKRI